MDLCTTCGSFGGNQCAVCQNYFCVSHGACRCHTCVEIVLDAAQRTAAETTRRRIVRLLERRRDEYARGGSPYARTALSVVNDLIDSISFITATAKSKRSQ